VGNAMKRLAVLGLLLLSGCVTQQEVQDEAYCKGQKQQTYDECLKLRAAQTVRQGAMIQMCQGGRMC
jgi:hypothetical protein